MPLDLKLRVSNDGITKAAAKRRILDAPFLDVTDKQLDLSAAAYMRRRQQTYPLVVSGQPLGSGIFREFLKDGKFLIDLGLSRLGALSIEIDNATKQAFGALDDIQREVAVLDSQLKEEELKLLKGFSATHHNKFVRAIDFSRGINDPEWKVDWKTGSQFLPEQQALVLPGRGCCLPLVQRERVPIVDVVMIAENTDFGDILPLVSTSPRNLLLPDRVFRHVIARTEYDGVSAVTYGASYLTVQLEFGSIQPVNSLTLKPVGQSVLTVDSVSYLDDEGVEDTLVTTSFSLGNNEVLIFEPVRTKFMKVVFSTKVPVSKTKYTNRDELVHQVNKHLRGVGFTQLLPEVEETISGRIYDFSLDSIVAHLLVFRPTGAFRSKGLAVNNPAGLVLARTVENLSVTKLGRVDGSGYVVPAAVANAEFYLGVDLKDSDGNRLVHELVPLPDDLPDQQEQLVVIGTDAKMKLFPDFEYGMIKQKVLTVEMPLAYPGTATMTTDGAHGLLVGETFNAYSSLNSVWNSLKTVTGVPAPDEIEITVTTDAYEVTENTRPFVYIYPDTGHTDPITVYEDGVAMVIGTDYQVSVDGGATWLTEFIYGTEWLRERRWARTGLFRIRLLAGSFDKSYYCSYRPLRIQRLGDSGKMLLTNRRVVFHGLGDCSGVLSTVIVHRASSVVPYVSPIVSKYTLKVMER